MYLVLGQTKQGSYCYPIYINNGISGVSAKEQLLQSDAEILGHSLQGRLSAMLSL